VKHEPGTHCARTARCALTRCKTPEGCGTSGSTWPRPCRSGECPGSFRSITLWSDRRGVPARWRAPAKRKRGGPREAGATAEGVNPYRGERQEGSGAVRAALPRGCPTVRDAACRAVCGGRCTRTSGGTKPLKPRSAAAAGSHDPTSRSTNGMRGSGLETGPDLRSDESPEGGIP
jgi:hypothetical protein